jgi:hypothetical protein
VERLITFENGRPKVGTTFLYGLRPMHERTGDIESLTGYAMRLASAHCLKPWTLFNWIALNSSGHHSEEVLSIAFWQKGLAGTCFGFSRQSSVWLHAIEELTGKRGLDRCTLNFLSSTISSQNICVQNRRFCSLCYEDLSATGGEAHEPLYWTLRATTACVRHKILLTDKSCGAPKTEHLPFRFRVFAPGNCDCCGRIAYRCNVINPQPASEVEMRISTQMFDLVTFGAQGGVLIQEDLVEGMREVVRTKFEGRFNKLALAADVPKSAIARLNRVPNVTIRMDTLLQLAYAGGCSVLSMLRGKPEFSFEGEFRRMRPKLSKGVIDWGRLDAAIHREAADGLGNQPLAVFAKKVGISYRSLDIKYPKEAELIRTQRRNFLKEAAVMHAKKLRTECNEIHERLIDQGLTPTFRNVEAITGENWWARPPQDRLVLSYTLKMSDDVGNARPKK